MSFILDALKKSESDRQRQSGPSLFEVKVAPPRRRLPIWAAAIAVLLVSNVVVVSWMLLRHPASQRPAAETATAPAAQAAAATALAPGLAGSAAPPGGAGASATAAAAALPQAGAGGQAARTAAAQPPSPGGAAPGSMPPGSGTDRSSGQTDGNPSDYAPAVEPAGTPSPATRAGAADELPLYQQIVSSADLPPLHLDLHVYAQRPQDRFAMINMHRVEEGDSLPSGPQVQAIRPDGVVLSYHGTRFLLPRN